MKNGEQNPTIIGNLRLKLPKKATPAMLALKTWVAVIKN